jgi:hypothetical protein
MFYENLTYIYIPVDKCYIIQFMPVASHNDRFMHYTVAKLGNSGGNRSLQHFTTRLWSLTNQTREGETVNTGGMMFIHITSKLPVKNEGKI